jgi:rubrerythrin
MSNEIILFERQTLSLALIEKELYQLYTSLSEKVEDVAARTLFAYISTDSLKHSTILVKIIEEVDGSKARENDCSENIIHTKELIKALTKNVAKSEKVDRKELITLLDTLADFENLLFSEYKKVFHLEYVRLSENEQKQKNEKDLNIFSLIVEDEERHQKILSAIARLCDRNLSFNKNNPIVKYNNPDSWYIPPRGGSMS